MNKTTMQFLYGDRELVISIADVLDPEVDVIVSVANNRLEAVSDIARHISRCCDEVVTDECEKFIAHHGELEAGMVAMTTAGSLPYHALLHAVSPQVNDTDPEDAVVQLVANCLRLCSMHDWHAIAFPDLVSEISHVSVELIAWGCYTAISRYWDARLDESPYRICMCMQAANFRPFVEAFRHASMDTTAEHTQAVDVLAEDQATQAGEISLNEKDLVAPDDEIQDWFK